jgi:hypothetical protein
MPGDVKILSYDTCVLGKIKFLATFLFLDTIIRKLYLFLLVECDRNTPSGAHIITA